MYGEGAKFANFVPDTRELLEVRGLPYRSENANIIVALPTGFGDLGIRLLGEDDTIIELSGFAWHTHAELIDARGGFSWPEATAAFAENIFSGETWMVEETRPDGSVEKWIHEPSPDDDRSADEVLRELLLPGHTIRRIPVA